MHGRIVRRTLRVLDIGLLFVFGVLFAPPARAQVIVTQPKSHYATVGLETTFSVVGSGITQYQWLFNGQAVAGATASSLSLSSLQTTDGGNYQAVVTGSRGSVTSAVARLVVGPVAAWGSDVSSGTLTNLPLDLTNVISVAASGTGVATGANGMALRADGTVSVWGDNSYGQTNVPSGLNGVRGIAMGSGYCLAVLSNGTVVAWGNNASGQATVPATATNITKVFAGGSTSAALRDDGTGVVWGNNANNFSLPPGLRLTSMAIGGACYGITTDNRAVTWSSSSSFSQIPGATNAVAVTAGTYGQMVLNADGSVIALGYQTSVPAGVTDIVAFSECQLGSSSDVRMALRSDGSLLVWNGGLVLPKVPAALTNLIAISTGASHALALCGSPAPYFTVSPTSRSMGAGDSVVFDVAAVGSGGVSYQWQFNGVDIPGATTRFLSVSNLQSSLAGDYAAVVTNSFGAATSLVAHLTVLPQVSVAAWGANGIGQCDIPAGLNDVVAVSGGASGPLFLKRDGTVTGLTGFEKVMPTNLTGVIAIAAGGTEHNLALRSDGSIVAWGTPSSSTFTNATSLPKPAIAIAAGDYHSLALKPDGTVAQWKDTFGVPGSVPAGLTNVVSIAAGHQFSLALKSDGTVVGWSGLPNAGTNIPAGLAGVTAIACGGLHGLALKQDGTVVAWGDNRYQQTEVPAAATNVVAVSGGGWTSFALRADGTVVAWGLNHYGQITIPSGLTNVQAVKGGPLYALALVGDGAPCVTWGPRGRTTVPGATVDFKATVCGTAPLTYQWQFNGTDIPGASLNRFTVTNVQASSAGCYSLRVSNRFGTVTSSCAVLTVANVAQWGSNSSEESWTPPGLTNVVQVGAGWSHSLALRDDGSLAAWGDFYCDPPPALGFTAVSANLMFSLGLTPGGSVIGWGVDDAGQTEPPPELTNAVAIAAGGQFGLALRDDGTVSAWGARNLPAGDYGQAHPPAGLSQVVAIAAGHQHAVALKDDGSVIGWGYSLGVPAGVSNAVAIASGGSHGLALKVDGTVAAWGASSYGLDKVPAGVTNVIAINCSENNDLAILADGTLLVWGYNGSGQTNVPPWIHNVSAAALGGGSAIALQGDGRPSITLQPFSRSVPAAGSTTFTVMSGGAAPLTYQWRFNGVDIVSGTNRSFTLANIAPTNAGDYTCVISNALGTVMSSASRLSVTLSPIVFDASAGATQITANGLKARITGLSFSGPSVVYGSSDLRNWAPVLTNAPALGSLDVVLPLLPGQAGFYRAVETGRQ